MPKTNLLETCCELLPLEVSDSSNKINIEDNGQPRQTLECQRHQILKLLICAYMTGWVFVACVVISIGRPSRQLLPVNYKGKTCGVDEQSSKPYLLYVDITLCAGLNAAESGCSSPAVCVAKCPNTYWASTQGNTSGLEQICDNLSGRPDADLSQLVEEGLCPAYIFPSRSVMGRCLPGLEDIEIHEAKLNEMKTYDGKILNATNLKEGIEYVQDSFDNLGNDQKLHVYMSVYWWIAPVCLVISSVIWTVVAFTCNDRSKTSKDNSKQTQAEKLKTLNIASKIIYEAKRKLKQNKTTLLFPIIPLFAKVVALFWPLAVSTTLSSLGSPQFRVVNACSTETCINRNTEETFRQDDLCDPEIFSKCTGCPRAKCVFHKFQHTSSRYILHGYNIVAALLLLYCAHKIVYTFATSSRDLLIKQMRAEVLSFLDWVRCGFFKTNSEEVEMARLDEQVEILIDTSGEDEYQGNQVQRKSERLLRQQRPVRHSAAHNTNAEKNAVTKTEQDSVQRVTENNEDSKVSSVRIIPIQRCSNYS